MRVIKINHVNVSVNDNNEIVKLWTVDKTVEIPESQPVRLNYKDGGVVITHGYNDKQVLNFNLTKDTLESVEWYLSAPVVSYRVIVQETNREALVKMRGLLSSFVMYGSQGLSKEDTERLGLVYRLAASLFDTKLANEIIADEHRVVPAYAAKDKLRGLVEQLFHLHYGFIGATSTGADLANAPIASVISGRMPENITQWALENGFIDKNQAAMAQWD